MQIISSAITRLHYPHQIDLLLVVIKQIHDRVVCLFSTINTTMVSRLDRVAGRGIQDTKRGGWRRNGERKEEVARG